MKSKNNSACLVSIVVPVYNVEKYLKKCLNSIQKQTYKNLQIILVDDGSTDNSGKICDEYAKGDKRIEVIHKKNGGLSSARNAGIDKCSGEYIALVDSDDYIQKNMIGSLCRCCQKYAADIGCTNKVRVKSNGKKAPDFTSKEEQCLTNKEALRLMLVSYDPSAWDKIYRRELFDGIRFPEGKLYEDIATIPKLILKAKKVCYDGKVGYYYMQNDDSIVHKDFTRNKLDYIKHTKWLVKFIKDNAPELIEEAEQFHILSVTTVLTDVYSARKRFPKEYEYVLEELKKYRLEYRDNQYISKAKKIMIWMDLYGMIPVVNLVKAVKEKLKYR